MSYSANQERARRRGPLPTRAALAVALDVVSLRPERTKNEGPSTEQGQALVIASFDHVLLAHKLILLFDGVLLDVLVDLAKLLAEGFLAERETPHTKGETEMATLPPRTAQARLKPPSGS